MLETKDSFQRLSVAIEALRFPLIVFIVMLHCYTSTVSQWSGHPTYFRIVYPFSLWLGETGVPAYFFISGLLLFYSKKTYSQKLQGRLKTLLIPYILFNAFILLGYWTLYLAGKPMAILGRSISDYNFVDFLRAFWDRGEWHNGNGAPLLCPFWYIRNLMLLVVISPVLYYLIKYTRILFPLVCGLLWVNSFHSAYLLQSLTMFSLGAYFPITGKNPYDVINQYRYWVVTLFLCFGLYDIAIHCTTISLPVFPQVHRLALVANVFLLIWLGEKFYLHGIYSVFLSKSSFFVFCIHYPFVLVLKEFSGRVTGLGDVVLALFYFCSVILVTVLCVVIYKILLKLVPGFLNFITGSRS